VTDKVGENARRAAALVQGRVLAGGRRTSAELGIVRIYLPGGEYSYSGAGRGALLILGREHVEGPLETAAARDRGRPGCRCAGCCGVAGVVRGSCLRRRCRGRCYCCHGDWPGVHAGAGIGRERRLQLAGADYRRAAQCRGRLARGWRMGGWQHQPGQSPDRALGRQRVGIGAHLQRRSPHQSLRGLLQRGGRRLGRRRLGGRRGRVQQGPGRALGRHGMVTDASP
jgi:hypothetical protein